MQEKEKMWFCRAVSYRLQNLFRRILFLIEAVNWISRSYEHNKSDFFPALWPTDRISSPRTALSLSLWWWWWGLWWWWWGAHRSDFWPNDCSTSLPIFTRPGLARYFKSLFPDASTTPNLCSFLFQKRLLLWCRQGFLSRGTLVLQLPDLSRTKDRISCLRPTDFLLCPFVFSFSMLSSSLFLEDGALTFSKFGLTGEWKKFDSIDIPQRTDWKLITVCINVRAQWEKGAG